MSDPFFFGYGSLVNRATHVYAGAHAAQAQGWRRVWRHTALRPVAFLTAEPDAQTAIDGLIAGVPRGDWMALDEREAGYDRLPLGDGLRHDLGQPLSVAIYSIPAAHLAPPDVAHPILLSYVDVVLQGYLREFGPEGAARFVATTDGWNAPLLDDRAAPRYPRHQRLTPQERDMVDELLADLPLRIVRADGDAMPPA